VQDANLHLSIPNSETAIIKQHQGYFDRKNAGTAHDDVKKDKAQA